jgi:hypothetical protein
MNREKAREIKITVFLRGFPDRSKGEPVTAVQRATAHNGIQPNESDY